MKYFHELTEAEWDKMKKAGMLWLEVARNYTGPPWCKDQAVAVDPLGCWSLIHVGEDYRITQEDDCRNCDLYKNDNNTK